MVANYRKTTQKTPPLVPCTLHLLRKIVAKELRRQADASSENRLASALGMPRATLRVRMTQPGTFHVDELDALLPKLKITLHVNLV